MACSVYNSVIFYLAFVCSVVESREALQPPISFEDLAPEVGAIWQSSREDGTACNLDVQKELAPASQLHPLYLVPGTNRLWYPNLEGRLIIPYAASIELNCQRGFANISQTSSSSLKLRCLGAEYFELESGGAKFQLRDFACNYPETYRVLRTNQTCAQTISSSRIYSVGFSISANRFLETLRICYDENELRTHYTQHALQPANKHFLRYVKRLKFNKAGYFKQYDMNGLYSKLNQQRRAETLIGKTSAHKLDNTTLFLTRGHLAAKSDQIYAAPQRATFNFFNAAPQWQTFNGGQWSQLEDELRKYVWRAGLFVDCYTGTWGTLQLIPGVDYYLATDANNNDILPVPALFFRVLVDQHNRKRGIALIGINDPDAAFDQIENTYIICTDIHEQIPWLAWIRNNNLKKGYLYACAVDEFALSVGHLPTELLSVTEILM